MRTNIFQRGSPCWTHCFASGELCPIHILKWAAEPTSKSGVSLRIPGPASVPSVAVQHISCDRTALPGTPPSCNYLRYPWMRIDMEDPHSPKKPGEARMSLVLAWLFLTSSFHLFILLSWEEPYLETMESLSSWQISDTGDYDSETASSPSPSFQAGEERSLLEY